MSIYSIKNVTLFAFLSVLLCSCQTISVRGQWVDDDAIQRLENKSMTKEEVVQLIGTPTVIADYNPDTWYYIQRTMAKRAWFDPKIIEQKILKINFVNGAIAEVVVLDNNHNDEINVDSEYTRVYGTELNGVQRFVKNIGRFNKTTDNKVRRGGK